MSGCHVEIGHRPVLRHPLQSIIYKFFWDLMLGRQLSAKLHGVTSQKKIVFILTAAVTSALEVVEVWCVAILSVLIKDAAEIKNKWSYSSTPTV
jgi:hypothetical protein